MRLGSSVLLHLHGSDRGQYQQGIMACLKGRALKRFPYYAGYATPLHIRFQKELLRPVQKQDLLGARLVVGLFFSALQEFLSKDRVSSQMLVPAGSPGSRCHVSPGHASASRCEERLETPFFLWHGFKYTNDTYTLNPQV